MEQKAGIIDRVARLLKIKKSSEVKPGHKSFAKKAPTPKASKKAVNKAVKASKR